MPRPIQKIIVDLDAFQPEDFEEDSLGEGYSRLHTVCAELREAPHLDQAIDSLFALFERLEGKDLGSPGPVVHTLESLAGYQDKLVLAVQRKPTTHTVWMLNRILNAPLPPERRALLLNLLDATLSHPLASTAAKDDAGSFIEHQRLISDA